MQVNREQLLKKRAWLVAIAATVEADVRDSVQEEIAFIDSLLEDAA